MGFSEHSTLCYGAGLKKYLFYKLRNSGHVKEEATRH